MNLHDKAEFERQLLRYDAAKNTPREHNARCDLTDWVARYTYAKVQEATAATLKAMPPLREHP